MMDNLNQPRGSSLLDTKLPGAIVLGGSFVGLGLVRSLGARGVETWVIDTDRSASIARFSKYTKRYILAEEDPYRLLLRLGHEHRLNGWVVLPVTDYFVDLLAHHHESLSSIYKLTTPPIEVTRFALDKRLTYRRAQELGIATPWTQLGDGPADEIEKNLRYPVILKPAINHHFFPQTNLKALPASNPSEFQQRYAQMKMYIPPEEILIQERIPGGGENQFSLCAICEKGRPYATLVAQRRRQYPVEFGNASSFVETTRQPVVERDGLRFLESIEFDGMVEIEFKFDPRDGRYKILDVNARPWGWHTLTGAAGADFGYLLWQHKIGRAVRSVPMQHKAAWLREITDFIAIAKSPRKGAEIRALLTAVRDRRLALATFDLRDPVPFFAELALWVLQGPARQRKARAPLSPGTLASVAGIVTRTVSENLTH
jgi:D-aspartate ligase